MSVRNLLVGIVMLILSLVIFVGGGWEITIQWVSNFGDSVFANENGFCFRFNEDCYGIQRTNLFFDSPIVSWCLLGLAIAMFFTGLGGVLKGLFVGN